MNLNLTCTPGTSMILPSDYARLVYLLVDIHSAGQRERAPASIVLLIDCSESMRIRLVSEAQFRQLADSGSLVEVMTDGVPAWQVKGTDHALIGQLQSRMDYVRRALERFGEQLGEEDTYSVVAFGEQAELLAPSTPGGNLTPLREAVQRLETMGLGDKTSLGDGLRLALEQARQQQAQQQQAQQPLSAAARRIVLLTDGYTGDVSRCYAFAEQARKEQIPITTIGVGAEFNEALLIPLADRTGGRACYIDQPEALPEIFAREAQDALSVLFRGLELSIQLPARVSLHRVSRLAPEIGRLDPMPEPGGASLFLGDYPRGGRIQLLLELVIERAAPSANLPLARLSLGFEDPLTPGPRQAQASASIAVRPGIEEHVDEAVARAVRRITASSLSSRVLEEAARLPLEDAAERLRQAAMRLVELGEPRLAEGVLLQAALLARQGRLDDRATKRLVYQTRNLSG